MKLGSWRTRTYPIRVSVDDKVVFSGTTSQSLGYVTITFPPAVGKSLKIELVGSTVERDAFGNIVELAAEKQSAATIDQVGTKGKLEIVEIEIYGPVGVGSNLN